VRTRNLIGISPIHLYSYPSLKFYTLYFFIPEGPNNQITCYVRSQDHFWNLNQILFPLMNSDHDFNLMSMLPTTLDNRILAWHGMVLLEKIKIKRKSLPNKSQCKSWDFGSSHVEILRTNQNFPLGSLAMPCLPCHYHIISSMSLPCHHFDVTTT